MFSVRPAAPKFILTSLLALLAVARTAQAIPVDASVGFGIQGLFDSTLYPQGTEAQITGAPGQ